MDHPPVARSTADQQRFPRLRFDRNELAGSFGDVGTDLPLIVAMIAAASLDGGGVFIVFGALQIMTGLLYGVPMPLQPLKAMAVIVITQRISANVLSGAAMSIAVIMLALSLSGGLSWLVRVIPKAAVRGIQLGLGLSLAALAIKEYLPALGGVGYGLASACFVIVVVLWNNRRIPAALIVVLIGLAFAAGWTVQWSDIHVGAPRLPEIHVPTLDDAWTGLLLLALPQLPLSISNSVIATEQTLRDLLPARAISARKIGTTYGVANLVSSLLGGIPVCHGCGGLAGHYAFGARTGGSVVIYGSIYLLLGLCLGDSVATFASAYPRPVLGVILLFEAVAIMLLIRDTVSDRRQFMLVLLVGAIAFGVPQGFLFALLVGTAVHYYWSWTAKRRTRNH